ncbi:MAG: UDP-N-acetyl-D-mannosamine dehydrogenase [Hydrogenimonas sp.]|nr:MAG: UDP-N-acetyl-D-mannosamine dehydrogenase [Hydrogenimonas sp.]
MKKRASNHPQGIQKICVLGLGYIGLPTAALLANRGFDIHGVDVVQSTVDTINAGHIHIVEPELDVFVQSAVKSGRLTADTQPTEADIFIIAVPTPFHEGYVPNIDYVKSAAESIIPYIKENNLIILESTSPVGTTKMVEKVLHQGGVDTSKVHIAHCPERVLPGRIMLELVQNDRIVGGLTPEATEKTAQFYESFVNGEVLKTDAKTAEMAKLTENSFRDVNIAFANELSILCDKFEINIWELIALANRHPRVNILQPGAGVGGHCIAVDPWFIVDAGGDDAKLIRTARERNDYKSEWVIQKIDTIAKEIEAKSGKVAKIACMGIAFKPNIDDLRESPALHIIQRLTESRDHIMAVEPNIPLDSDVKEMLHISNETFQLSDIFDAIEEADLIVFLVAHKQFKRLDYHDLNCLDFCGVMNRANHFQGVSS